MMETRHPNEPDDLPDDERTSAGRSVVQHVAGWVGTLLLVVVVSMGVGRARAPDLPEAAPAFRLPDLEEGLVSLEQYRGQTVVLNFWATWCGPCRLEIPSFSSFAAAHPDVVVLGIAADGPPSKLRAAARDLEIGYPVLQGDAQTLAAYGISSFPTTVIVGPDGLVQHAHVGVLLRPQLALLIGRLW